MKTVLNILDPVAAIIESQKISTLSPIPTIGNIRSGTGEIKKKQREQSRNKQLLELTKLWSQDINDHYLSSMDEIFDMYQDNIALSKRYEEKPETYETEIQDPRRRYCVLYRRTDRWCKNHKDKSWFFCKNTNV